MPPTIADVRLKTYNLKKLGNSDKKKWKVQTAAKYSFPSLKIKFQSYLVENSQKGMLKFYFKSRYEVKPSKFSIYFAHDWRYIPDWYKTQQICDKAVLEKGVMLECVANCYKK